jgi:hypothetical protein
LLAGEVDVFNSHLQGFEKAEAGAVEQRGAEVLDARHLGQDGRDLTAAEDDGEVLGPLRVDDAGQPGYLAVEDALIQEKQGGQRLVLGRGAHLTLGGEGAEEAGDLGLAELVGMALAVE